MHNVVLSPISTDLLVEKIAQRTAEMILSKQSVNKESTKTTERKHDAQGAADFLGITLPTLYTKVSKGELPSCKAPGGKRLFFFESDLINLLKSGRKSTNTEIESEAKAYLSINKKGLCYEK